MAPTLAAEATTAPHLLSNNFEVKSTTQSTVKEHKPAAKDVLSDFHYYLDPGDGSPPPPSIVGKPETYTRPAATLQLVAHDIRGTENEYSLDKTGFQVYRHTSKEKQFQDDEEIKKVYYPEIEEILKDA